MPKRKAMDLAALDEPRRSSRRITTKSEGGASGPEVKVPAPKKTKKDSKVKSEDSKNNVVIEKGKIGDMSDEKPVKPVYKLATATTESKPIEDNSSERQYWLLKAEPESRIEKGKDIKFSIDDLAAKTEPEPWDGIRNFAARNNLRAMKKGDLALFYHSSCKVPAIVGTMEIVEEHTPDCLSFPPRFNFTYAHTSCLAVSAHDPSAPYYDASSKPSEPKWSVVHVTFRQKLGTPITLKELKAWQAEKGHPLESMQMLKLTRMSVSKVSEAEWQFLVEEMKKRGDDIKQ
ncbi:uncharacterized protein RSE6_16031 [Rhynchosporium secalis]|uniref:EVE domain-containing protein n=1 Tax=Rhynchosporium secalis TaxID=38038 RepID=A0A1E1M256_RHYSE|nr:uncharacterized protein RSE6_16031 [Rhynchosporium secalis]